MHPLESAEVDPDFRANLSVILKRVGMQLFQVAALVARLKKNE